MLGANVKTRDERDDEGNEVELEVVNFLRSKGYSVQATGLPGSIKGAPQFWLPESNEYCLSADLLAAKDETLLIIEAKKRKLYTRSQWIKGYTFNRSVIYLNEQSLNGIATFVERFKCADGIYALKLPDGDLVGQTFRKLNASSAQGHKPAEGKKKKAFYFDVDDFVPLGGLC